MRRECLSFVAVVASSEAGHLDALVSKDVSLTDATHLARPCVCYGLKGQRDDGVIVSVPVGCKFETSFMPKTRSRPRYSYRLDLKITASEQVLNALDLKS